MTPEEEVEASVVDFVFYTLPKIWCCLFLLLLLFPLLLTIVLRLGFICFLARQERRQLLLHNFEYLGG